MSLPRVRSFLFICVLLLLNFGCGSSGGGNASAPNIQTAPPFSKQQGLQCLTQGDVGCAQRNFCALASDPSAGLRCCVSQFLQNYFSDNTRELGKMLGYAPLSFDEVRKLSRQDIVKSKALPFGELFLLSAEDSPKIADLLEQWGLALIQQNASTEELAKHLSAFGAGLEQSSACLAGVIPNFRSDSLEKEIFVSEQPVDVSARDLNFLEFVTGTFAYALQGAGAYQAGFANFPSLPVSDAFLADLNGHAGPNDARLGDLSDEDAAVLAAKLGLLQTSFSALKTFGEVKDAPARIDAYLNWRFSEETQKSISGMLKSGYLSLIQSKWVDLPEEGWQVNLSNLGNPVLLPNSRRVDAQKNILSRDSRGDIQVNHDFLKAWASSVVQEVFKQ